MIASSAGRDAVGESDLAAADASEFLRAVTQSAESAYAPYSGFHVGALAIDTEGRVYPGANMENASYGLSICAEVGALSAATSQNALDKIKAVVVVGGRCDNQGRLIVKQAVLPCGRCRQLIAEAAELGGRDILVMTFDADKKIRSYRISELLPLSFGRESLD